MILGPFHRPNCNADASCDDDDEDDSLSLLHDMANDDLHRFIQHLESIHDSLVKEPLESSPTSTDFCLPDVNLDELGHRARKHLEQIGSIIAQMDQLDLLQSNTCFVEMGAGRGQLSHELHACLKNDSTIHFALIERDHQRYRFDAHHRLQHQGPSFKRYRLDIRDLYLPELPSIKATQPSPHIVIISKHLCGGATDLALRCAMEAQRDHGHIRAILIALCCHHRLMWNDYIGKAFFSRHNLTSKDFVLIRSLASWCTSGNRHRMPQEGKRSTIGRERTRRRRLALQLLLFRWTFSSVGLIVECRSIDHVQATSLLHGRTGTNRSESQTHSRLGSHRVSERTRISSPPESLRVENDYAREYCSHRHTVELRFLL